MISFMYASQPDKGRRNDGQDPLTSDDEAQRHPQTQAGARSAADVVVGGGACRNG